MLVDKSYSYCKNCNFENIKSKSDTNNRKAVLAKPAHLNAPLKNTSSERIKLTLQQTRIQCKQLEKQVHEMRIALDKNSHAISPELSNDFQKIFSESKESDIPPFMNLFWQEQQKYVTVMMGLGVFGTYNLNKNGYFNSHTF